MLFRICGHTLRHNAAAKKNAPLGSIVSSTVNPWNSAPRYYQPTTLQPADDLKPAFLALFEEVSNNLMA